jgi:hypothetical protein
MAMAAAATLTVTAEHDLDPHNTRLVELASQQKHHLSLSLGPLLPKGRLSRRTAPRVDALRR